MGGSWLDYINQPARRLVWQMRREADRGAAASMGGRGLGRSTTTLEARPSALGAGSAEAQNGCVVLTPEFQIWKQGNDVSSISDPREGGSRSLFLEGQSRLIRFE